MKLLLQIKDILAQRKLNRRSLSGYLVKGTVGTLIIQASTILLTFLSNFIAAKLLGAAKYGTFTYIFTCITVAANIALVGFNTLLIRETAVYKNQLDWGRLKGLIKMATFAVFCACIILAALIIVLFKSLDIFSKIGNLYFFQLSLIALPLFTFTLVFQSVLQGLQKILTGQLAEKIIKPLAFIALTLVIYFFYPAAIEVTGLIWINIIAFGIGFVSIAGSLVKNLSPLLHNVKAKYENRKWMQSTLYFFVIGIAQIVNARADILLLGGWKGNAEVGIYSIAVRLSDFIAMSLFVLNTVTAPVISGLYYSNQNEKLQKLITASARTAMVLSLPVALVLVIGGKSILSLFGNEFSAGYIAMLIIVAAQIINVGCGPAGNILIMTGNEKYAFFSLLISSVLNIALNILLIPYMGMNGTAIAVALSIVTWNVLMLFFVRRKTKIYSAIFGNF